MKNKIVLGFIFLCASTVTYAQDSGFYLGASVGQSDVDLGFSAGDVFDDLPSGVSISTDEEDTTYSFNVGYNLNENWSLDAAIVDLGEASISVTDGVDRGDVDVSVDGYTIGVTGSLPLSDRFKLFAKAGVLFWEGDIKATVSGEGTILSDSDDGNDAYYGFGAAYIIDQIELFIDYTFNEIDDVDVDVISVGIKYNF